MQPRCCKWSKNIIPDMFILDIMMPGISGIDLCRTLRTHEATRETPVIMLCVSEQPTDGHELLECRRYCLSLQVRYAALARDCQQADWSAATNPVPRQEFQARFDMK